MKKISLVLTLAASFVATTANAGWWQMFGGARRDEGTCVQETSDGGYIVTGVTWSFGNVNNANIWLIKLDSLGHKEWDKTYGDGWGKSVRQTSDGGYIIAGSKLIKTDEIGDTLWTRSYASSCIQQTTDGGYIILNGSGLLKLDINGDSLWAKGYAKIGGYGDRGNYIEQTKDSGYIVTGYAIWVDTENMLDKTAFLMRKTDKEGNEEWHRSFGGTNWFEYDRGNCVRQCSDGGYIIAGTLIADGKLYSLLKTDSNGDSLWKSILGGEFYCVEETNDGGYIAVGCTEWATLNSMGMKPQGAELWLQKLNSLGDTIWTRTYGGSGVDAGRYVQQTTDDGYIITGYSSSYTAEWWDLYLLKTDSLGLLSVKEKSIVETNENWDVALAISHAITLRYKDMPQGFRAAIFDASGRVVDEINSPTQSGVITWGEGYPSGVYFIQVNDTKHTNTAKIVLVH